jgi:uncharacterized damage-inducible protein DinB
MPRRRVSHRAGLGPLTWTLSAPTVDNPWMSTPYAQYVGLRDPVDVLRESLGAYVSLSTRITPDTWNRPVAPGKWTVRQVIVHTAQFEMILGNRLRCGVGVPNYVVQPVEQDELIAEAESVDGPTALATLIAVRRMNLAFAASLTSSHRKRTMMHPERGTIDVDDILTTLAGHGVHHLQQVAAIQ